MKVFPLVNTLNSDVTRGAQHVLTMFLAKIGLEPVGKNSAECNTEIWMAYQSDKIRQSLVSGGSAT